MAFQVDDGRLAELVVESRDLHAGAMRAAREPLDAIVEHGRSRRAMLRRTLTAAGLSTGLLAVTRAAADTEDVQALQTAASLENLAVTTYGKALTLPFIRGGNKTVKAFAETTMKQHADHAKAFNAKATALGGKPQTAANPKYLDVVMKALPGIKGPADVVALAISLEDVATSTYVRNVEQVSDGTLRTLFASVAGVEAQHLTTLLAVQALLRGGAAALITVKATGAAVDAAKLPAAAGSVGFPEAFKQTMKASPTSEGAVR